MYEKDISEVYICGLTTLACGGKLIVSQPLHESSRSSMSTLIKIYKNS